MTTNRPLRVFLCHSSADKPAVRELYQKLRAEPWIQPWLDEEELFPGMDWNLEIEKAIEATDVILVCLSNNSITKEGYVQREIRIALDYADYKPEGTLFIIPVRLEECTPPKRLARWQYADYFDGVREKTFMRLLETLKKHLEIIISNKIEEDDKVPQKNNIHSSLTLQNNQLLENKIKVFSTNLQDENSQEKLSIKKGVLLKLVYDERGVLQEEKNFLGDCAELMYAVENNEQINIEVEFSQITKIDTLLANYAKNPLPDLKSSQIGAMRIRKDLLNQQKLLMRGVTLTLSQPIYQFLYSESLLLSLVLKGFGELLFESPRVPPGAILLDLWYKENSRISTVIMTFPKDEEEKKRYFGLLGSGWDLYDISKQTRYEKAIPAIIIEYLRLLDKNKIEDSKDMLDINKWGVGLR